MSDIIFDRVNENYRMGEVTIHVTKWVFFHIKKGEIYIILDPSGTGETTILNLLGSMEIVTSGKILFGGKNIAAMNDLELISYRRYKIDFVFQFYNLTPNLTAMENVEFARQVCRSLLEPGETLRIVGLKDRIHSFPAQLSGGKQQRVTVVRAIYENPGLLLYNGPTGALNTETGKTILKVLSDISRNMGKTVIIIAHNSLVTPITDRPIKMKSGMVVKGSVQDSPADLEGIKW